MARKKQNLCRKILVYSNISPTNFIIRWHIHLSLLNANKYLRWMILGEKKDLKQQNQFEVHFTRVQLYKNPVGDSAGEPVPFFTGYL